jgi:hypothetical protein
VLIGSIGMLGEYYSPTEIIGGCCPRVAGAEEDLVWNAAAEACDTERIHLVWSATEDRVWYLAVRSQDLASNPNTWCPFASLLPGMKEANSAPVCYTFFSDETATLMVVTEDNLQIFRGTTLVIRAKAERMSRELANAPVIELVPDRIMQLTPAPWYSLSLFENRARRILAGIAVATALVFATLSFVVWLFASLELIAARHNLSETLMRTESKSMDMMNMVETLHASPMRTELAKFAELNDGLLAVNGFLEVYEVRSGKTRWRAVVPSNVTADRISALGGKTIGPVDNGIAIGNAAELAFEAGQGNKR